MRRRQRQRTQERAPTTAGGPHFTEPPPDQWAETAPEDVTDDLRHVCRRLFHLQTQRKAAKSPLCHLLCPEWVDPCGPVVTSVGAQRGVVGEMLLPP